MNCITFQANLGNTYTYTTYTYATKVSFRKKTGYIPSGACEDMIWVILIRSTQTPELSPLHQKTTSRNQNTPLADCERGCTFHTRRFTPQQRASKLHCACAALLVTWKAPQRLWTCHDHLKWVLRNTAPRRRSSEYIKAAASAELVRILTLQFVTYCMCQHFG